MKPRRSPWLIVGVLVAGVVAVNLGLRELDKRTRSPGGPVSSSFATAPEGTAAYAELLRRFGRPVLRLRDDTTALDASETLVLLDPDRTLPALEIATIRSFVKNGGRLLAGGNPTGWLGNLVFRPPEWRPYATETARAEGVPGVRVVRTAGEGAWVKPKGRVLVWAQGDPIVVEQDVSAGKVLLLADPSPLQNRLLAEADNAALGLALAGERPVAFAESMHGYGPASGLGAVPTRWWWVFGGLFLAAVVLALARGRRLGPAGLPARELPPARVEFAEALATQLAMARRRGDNVRTARRVARTRVARRLALSPSASDEELRARASARGVEAGVIEAVTGEGTSEADLLAVGRALRNVEREETSL